MSFEKYEGSSRGRKKKYHPAVKIWASGKIAFNDIAVEEWLDDAEYVAVFTHSDHPRIGLEPASPDEAGQPHVYTLHTQGSYTGKLLQVKKLLRDLECTRPDESLLLDAHHDETHDLLVVDLDPLT